MRRMRRMMMMMRRNRERKILLPRRWPKEQGPTNAGEKFPNSCFTNE
jgi:hypothetical protein